MFEVADASLVGDAIELIIKKVQCYICVYSIQSLLLISTWILQIFILSFISVYQQLLCLKMERLLLVVSWLHGELKFKYTRGDVDLFKFSYNYWHWRVKKFTITIAYWNILAKMCFVHQYFLDKIHKVMCYKFQNNVIFCV